MASRRQLAATLVVIVAAVASLATSPARWSMERRAPLKHSLSKVDTKIAKGYAVRSSHQQRIHFTADYVWRGSPAPTARVQIDVFGVDPSGARQTTTHSIDTSKKSGKIYVDLPPLACPAPPCAGDYQLRLELKNAAPADAIELDGAFIAEMNERGDDKPPPSANLILIQK